MLPSKGYLKLLDCPYYSRGICDRPYCHFKHKKKEGVEFLPLSQEEYASAQITNSSYDVTQEHVVFWDNQGLNFEVEQQSLTTNVSYEYNPMAQPQYISSSVMSENRPFLNTNMQHNITGVFNNNLKYDVIENLIEPKVNDFISDYFNLESLKCSVNEATEIANASYFQNNSTDVGFPLINSIDKNRFLESTGRSEEIASLFKIKNQSGRSDEVTDENVEPGCSVYNMIRPVHNFNLIKNVKKKPERHFVEPAGFKNALTRPTMSPDSSEIKESKFYKGADDGKMSEISKNCYKSLTMKYRKNECSHNGKPYPTKFNLEKDEKRICKVRSKGIDLAPKKTNNRSKAIFPSPLNNSNSVKIDSLNKIISEKMKQLNQILSSSEYLQIQQCLSSSRINHLNGEPIFENSFTKKSDLESDHTRLCSDNNTQFKDDPNTYLVDNRVKTHTKTRISLGLSFQHKPKKRVDILTPAERMLMLAKKRSLESNGLKTNYKPLRIRSVPNVESLLKEKERLLRKNTNNVESRNKNQSNSFLSKEQLDYELDEAPIIITNIPHPQKSGADSETRQKCLEKLYRVERQLVRPGRSYHDAHEKCLQSESKIWIETTHETYQKKMKSFTDMRKSNISSFTLKYFKSIKPRKETTFLEDYPLTEKVQSEKFNLSTITKRTSLYSVLLKYRLSDEQLETEGYPIRKKDSNGNIHLACISKSSVDRWNTTLTPPLGMYTCINCKKFYSVDENGLSIDPYGCTYHAKTSWFDKIPKKRYRCCGGRIYNPCMKSKYHSTEKRDLQNMLGFVETLKPKGEEPEEGWGVFALDCEMYWSTQGQELGRVSVVNAENRIVYDTFVKPENYVTDYCTKISGLTEENLSSAPVSLADVQKAMLQLFNSRTILIGHSLETDLKVLKLIHRNIVDTAIVFQTHEKKASLKLLATNYLKEVIQSKQNGHDSVEDAITCLKLMKRKILEDNAFIYKISKT